MKNILEMRTFSAVLQICGWLGCLVLAGACRNESSCYDPVDVSKIEAPVRIVRLEETLFTLKTADEVRAWLRKYPDLAEKYFQLNRLPHDSVLINPILAMTQEPHQDTLLRDVRQKYPDLKTLELEFEAAFKHLKYYFPDFKVPRIYTLTTGLGSFFGTDVMVGEGIVVISLDFFLGKAARYRPPVEQMPDYIWKRYHEGSIVPTVMLYLSNRYNQTQLEDKTLLAEMVYYGKAYHFVRQMMPCLPDSLLYGYTETELNNLAREDNRDYIWNHFIEKNVLFSNSQFVKNTYLDERPYVAEINAKCPGRIGRWLGVRIIENYRRRNPKIGLPELMATADAPLLFNRSGYNGQ
ncbi:MAG: gliding motility lipoprotein GldB [Microscillaceae bacterium]|nr:gliding motility lipoprotein GldB [Microscillaceae bacterium]